MLSLQTGTLDPPVDPGQAALSKSSVNPWVVESGSRHPVESGAEMIWREFGHAEVHPFMSQETTHSPLWFSLTLPAPLALDAMVQAWPRI